MEGCRLCKRCSAALLVARSADVSRPWSFQTISIFKQHLGKCLELQGHFYMNLKSSTLYFRYYSLSASKVHYSGAKLVETAPYIAASIFNDGHTSVLLIMQLLNLEIDPSALQFCETLDSQRISIANLRAQQETKEAMKLKRAAQNEAEDITATIEDLVYGPGIAD